MGSRNPTSGATSDSPLQTRRKTCFIPLTLPSSGLEFGGWGYSLSLTCNGSGNFLSHAEEETRVELERRENGTEK